MGAVPVKIGFGELYSALDRGTVDCTVNYTVFVKSYKHYEVAKHLMMAYMGSALVMAAQLTSISTTNCRMTCSILDRASDRYMDNYGKNLIDDAKAAAEMAAGIDEKVLNFAYSEGGLESGRVRQSAQPTAK